jgi:hypothetical protein
MLVLGMVSLRAARCLLQDMQKKPRFLADIAIAGCGLLD